MKRSSKQQAAFDRMDRDLDADRRFFERRPDRSYMVRRSFPFEILTNEIASRGEIKWRLPPPHVFHTAVYQLKPGIRFRLFFGAPSGTDTDVGEVEARRLWDNLVSRSPETQRRLQEATAALAGI